MQLDTAHTLSLSLSPSAGLFSAVHPTMAMGQQLCDMNDEFHSCLQHLPPVDLEPGTTDWLHNFAKLVEGPLPAIWSRPPPIAFAQHQYKKDKIVIANDLFGDGKIYTATSKDLSLFASAPVPLILSKDAPQVNERSWQHYLAFDWLIDDEYFYNGISVLEPGNRVIIEKSELSFEASHDYFALKSRGKGKGHADDTINAGIDILKATKRFGDNSDLMVGLSGGRDSRCVVAMMLSAGIEANFFTQRPPDLEVEVARMVIEASPKPLNWTVRVNAEADPDRALPDLLGNSKHWFEDRDGDCWPSFVRTRAMTGPPRPSRKWRISGGGGEIARGHFYRNGDLEPIRNRFLHAYRLRSISAFFHSTQTKGAKDDRVLAQLARSPQTAVFLTRKCQDNVHKTLEEFLENTAFKGIESYYQLDWFYVRSQQRRRVPIAYNNGILYPLYTPQMFLQGFSASLHDKLKGRTTSDLTGRMIPEWKDIPYFTDLQHKKPKAEINKTSVLPYYWEQDRDAFLSFIDHAIDLSQEHLIDDAKAIYRQIKRGDRRAPKLQNFANRLAWRVGFEAYDREIRQELAQPEPPLPIALTTKGNTRTGT